MKNRNITYASVSDYKALLRFEKKVFRAPFLRIMPKMYKEREKCAAYHRLVKSGNKIVGAYAAYPNEFITSHGCLKAVGIGSVAVSKKHRGEGIMSQMMGHAESEARESKTDIGYLSGYRHRYERFGYVPCGERYVYDVTQHYIKRSKTEKNFSFSPVHKCRESLSDISALFEKQSVHWKREKEEFSDIVSTWSDKCFVIYDGEKRFSGYLITNALIKEINEIQLCEASLLSDVIVSFAKKFSKKEISVCFAPWQEELLREIGTFGEHFHVRVSASIKFFSFKKPIEIMMNEKLNKHALCEGSIVLKLGEETLRVTVKNRACEVAECDSAPDIMFSYSEAVTALTTHHAIAHNALFKAWSPMCPIAVPHVDMV